MSEVNLQKRQLEFFNSNKKVNIFRSNTSFSRGKGGTKVISELIRHKVKYGYGELNFILFPISNLMNQYLFNHQVLGLEGKIVGETYRYFNDIKSVSLNIKTNNFNLTDSVRGEKYDAIFIDEVQFQNEFLNTVISRLKENGSLYINYTPSDNIEKDVYLDYYFKNKSSTSLITGFMSDNKYLPNEYKEAVFQQYKHLI